MSGRSCPRRRRRAAGGRTGRTCAGRSCSVGMPPASRSSSPPLQPPCGIAAAATTAAGEDHRLARGDLDGEDQPLGLLPDRHAERLARKHHAREPRLETREPADLTPKGRSPPLPERPSRRCRARAGSVDRTRRWWQTRDRRGGDCGRRRAGRSGPVVRASDIRRCGRQRAQVARCAVRVHAHRRTHHRRGRTG